MDSTYSLKAPAGNAGSAYGHAWEIVKKNFLELLLLVFVYIAIESPLGWINSEYAGQWGEIMYRSTADNLTTILYWVLILTPFEYGLALLFLRQARGEKFEFREIISGYNQFVQVVLSRILVVGIVIAGLILFIVPGIIFAIKLVFVPYLVMDKKMGAVDAVKESWKMTSGYGIHIFVMAIMAFLLVIGGLLALIVGVLVSVMWIEVAFASMYFAVDSVQPKEATQMESRSPSSENAGASTDSPE